MAGPAVRVVGLRDLRRDLRKVAPEALKELRQELRDAAQLVASAARPKARRRTGEYAESIRAGTSGDRALVRSPLPYANVAHWGGTTGPGHEHGPGQGSVVFDPQPAIPEAAEQLEDPVLDRIERGIDRALAARGFK